MTITEALETADRGLAAAVRYLIALREAGGDCSEDESAFIKRFFDSTDPIDNIYIAMLAANYSLEWDEWHDEVEKGLR